MATSMQQRRGSIAEWVTANEILPDGAIGVEENTGNIKIGDGTTGWNDLPYSTLSPSIFDTIGDLIVGAGENAYVKLARGSTDQILAVKDDGTLYWATKSDVPLSTVTAAGDLIVGSGSGAVSKLAKGSNSQQLAIVAGNLAWVTSSDIPLSVVTARGDLIVGSGVGTVTRLPTASLGSMFVSSGVGGYPVWIPPGAAGQGLGMVLGSPTWLSAIPLLTGSVGIAGDLVVASGAGSGAATRLPLGNDGQVLTVSGGAPTWRPSKVVVCTSTTRPAANVGIIIFETDTKASYISDGATWQLIPTEQTPQNFITGNSGNNNRKLQQGAFTFALTSGISTYATVTFGSVFGNVPSIVASAQYSTSAGLCVLNIRSPLVSQFDHIAKAMTGSYSGSVSANYIATDA